MIGRVSLILLACLLSGASQAAGYNTPATSQYQASTLRGSIGLRYWYSQAHSDMDSGDFDLVSTDGVSGHSAEIVGELQDLTTNMFARGFFGFGRSVGGDGDFLGYASSDLDQTTLAYVVVDGGWQFAQFAENNVRLKGFVGYHYLNDGVQAIDNSSVLQQNRQWHAIRVGMTAEGDIGERIGWTVDVAAVPWSHNRVDQRESNWTHGIEADAMLNVDLTQNWQVGVGGRYWWLQSNFDRRWLSNNDKLVYEQNYKRYGLLLESRYLF